VRPAGETQHGKIEKALWLTEKFAPEIEADLHRYYGLNLGLFFVPGSGLSWRKLLVLTEHLPPESTLNTAIRNSMPERDVLANFGDPVNAPWSPLESLVAALIDEVRQLAWMYASAHSDATIKRPEPIRRPGIGGRSSRGHIMSAQDIKAIDPRMRNIPDDQVQDALDALTGRTTL
jgi:hypothetical protein